MQLYVDSNYVSPYAMSVFVALIAKEARASHNPPSP